MEYLLSTNNLVKLYKNYKAVNKVSIHVNRGDIYGFIGRNGAGKSTFLRMISGLSEPSEGVITIAGYSGKDLRENNYFSKIGTLIEAPGLFMNMSAFQNVKAKCICYGIRDNDYVKYILAIVGLDNTKEKKVKNFSLGMKQRLGIALSLVGNPEILVLDEPINGLDPQGIVEIRDILQKLNEEKGMTIIISSHILEELHKVATKYGIISNGELLYELSKEQLMDKCGKKIEIESDNNQLAVDTLNELGIVNIKLISDRLIHVFEHLDDTILINKTLVKAGVGVSAIRIINESLEDFYFNITGGL